MFQIFILVNLWKWKSIQVKNITYTKLSKTLSLTYNFKYRTFNKSETLLLLSAKYQNVNKNVKQVHYLSLLVFFMQRVYMAADMAVAI